MPIKIINNDGSLSLLELQAKMYQGYSVVRSPHIGNQHPSTLVCAALGIPLNLVTFTSGARDKNSHPHMRIASGKSTQIADPNVWTPFGVSDCGVALEEYHLQELRARFPQLQVQTDIALMNADTALAEVVLRTITTTTSRLWYRSVSATGDVTKYKGEAVTNWEQIAQDIFRLSNEKSGWLIPNRALFLFESVLQSLSSGKEVIYHLSGVQMIGYIGGAERVLSKAYDALRLEMPRLPETLQINIVPVASARMITHVNNQDAYTALENSLRWYEKLAPEDRRAAKSQFTALTKLFPEFTDSIESGTFLSQYDIASVDDLLLSEWMLETPLKWVSGMYRQLLRSVV